MKTHAVVFPEPKRVEIREMDVPDVGPRRGGHPDGLLRGQPGDRALGADRSVRPLRRRLLRVLPVLAGLPGRGRRRGGRRRRHRSRRSATTCSRWARTSTTRTTSTPDPARRRTPATWWRPRRRCGASRPRSTSPAPRCSTWPGSRATAIRLTGVAEGDLVALIGLGMIGQMAAQAARRVGARVIATDLIAERVELAGDAIRPTSRSTAPTESLEDVVRAEAPAGCRRRDRHDRREHACSIDASG